MRSVSNMTTNKAETALLALDAEDAFQKVHWPFQFNVVENFKLMTKRNGSIEKWMTSPIPIMGRINILKTSTSKTNLFDSKHTPTTISRLIRVTQECVLPNTGKTLPGRA